MVIEVVLGELLGPYIWFSSCSFLIKGPEHELFIQKSQLHFANPSFSILACKAKTGSAVKVLAKPFQIVSGLMEKERLFMSS